MAFSHGKLAGVMINQFEMTQYLTEVSAPLEVEATETTVFGNGNKQYIPGLADGTLSMSGFQDGDNNAINQRFNNMALDTQAVSAITYTMAGFVDGATCFIGAAYGTSIEASSSVGDANEISGEFQVTGGLAGGFLLRAKYTVSGAATQFGTSIDRGGASQNGMDAHLHVTANQALGTLIAKVQHSTDDVTFTDLITFDTVPSSTWAWERKSVTGTVNRYVRSAATTSSTGAVTYTIAAARR